MDRRVVIWCLLVGAMLGLQAWALWGEAWGTAENPASGPRWQVGEIADAASVDQSFVMQAQGLRAITIVPRPVNGPVTATVVFELFDVSPDGDRPLFKVLRAGNDVVRDGRPYRLEFSPVALPDSRRFRLRVSCPGALVGHGFTLDAVKADAYPLGFARVNQRHVWGDLVFSTDAVEARLVNRLDRIWRPYPRPFGTPAFFYTAWALVTLLVAWMFWLVVSERPDPDTVPGAPLSIASVRAMVQRLAASTLVRLVLVLVVLAVLPAAWRALRERVVLDMFEALPDAELRTGMGDLHDGFSTNVSTTVGEAEQCIHALPPSRMTWSLDVPNGAVLRVRVGMRRDTWYLPGDGAVFRVSIASPQGFKDLRRLHMGPSFREADRTFRLLRFDLSRFAGQRVNIVFNTESGPSQNAVNDAAMWCGPRVTVSRF